MLEPKALKKLTYDLSKLPGVGPKTAKRLALFLLKQPASFAKEISVDLSKLHSDIKRCKFCGVYSDTNPCSICGDSARRLDMLAVVKSPGDVYTLENLGVYTGQYLVLNADDLHYEIEVLNKYGERLFKRVSQQLEFIKRRQQRFEGSFEIIFALGAGIEEQTLMLFLKDYLSSRVDRFKHISFRFSRLAIGLSGGSNLDFVDSYTLREAFSGRRGLD